MIAINLLKNFCYSLENQITFVTQDLEDKDYLIKNSSAPSIGWILAHILVSHDFIINHSMLGNNIILTPEFIKSYNTGSSGETGTEFTAKNILNDFRRINAIVVEQILTKEDAWLEEYPKYTENFPKTWLNKNNMKCFVLYFNHALNHTGQILELKRNLGKRVWGE